jgi:hypothetical protein
MRVKSRTASIVWKACIVASGVVGLAMTSGLLDGTFDLRFLCMFTNLSNIAVAVYFICALVALSRDKNLVTYAHTPKMIVTMGITLTFLIAHFMLSGMLTWGGTLHVDMLLLHYVVPIMTILDWVLFDEKGLMGRKEPLVWTVEPLVYLAAVEVLVNVFDVSVGGGMGDSRYPYPFLDASSLGWPTVIGFIIAVTVAFVALGFVWVAIDRRLAKRAQGTSGLSK